MKDDSSSASDVDRDQRCSGSDLEKGDIDIRGSGEDEQGETAVEPGLRPNAVPTNPTDASAEGDSTGDSAGYQPDEAEGRVSAVLSRVLSRTSAKSCPPGPPPDGGLRAWIVVACGHLVIMNTWGFINSFGIFQTYYATKLGRPPSDIAWIGSFQVFLLFFIGTFTGRLTDAGFFRALFIGGTALAVGGLFATAECGDGYWRFFLAQGVCVGLGNGCLFCPCMAVLSTYFRRRRAFAIGITACGSATGGLVFPSVVRQLLPAVGFAWTMRALAFITLASLVVANVGIRPRIAPRRSGRIVEWGAFRELEYTFYAVGSFFIFWGVYFAFFYLASFSRDVVGISYISSLNLLLVVNGVGSFGRIIPNHFADKLGTINMFIIISFSAGVIALCWTAVTSASGLYAWSVFYGTAGGGIQSLFPAGLTSLTTDLKKTGVRMGMIFTIVSFATLTGPPIAGAIISSQGGRYIGAQVFAGATLLLGSGFLVAARAAKSRRLGLGRRAKV